MSSSRASRRLVFLAGEEEYQSVPRGHLSLVDYHLAASYLFNLAPLPRGRGNFSMPVPPPTGPFLRECEGLLTPITVVIGLTK